MGGKNNLSCFSLNKCLSDWFQIQKYPGVLFLKRQFVWAVMLLMKAKINFVMDCSLYFFSAVISHSIKVSRVLSLKTRNRKEPPRGQQYRALLWKQVCWHQALRTATSSAALLRCGDSYKEDRSAPLMPLISCHFLVVEVWRKEKHCFRAWTSITGQRQPNPKGNIPSKPFPSVFLPL